MQIVKAYSNPVRNYKKKSNMLIAHERVVDLSKNIQINWRPFEDVKAALNYLSYSLIPDIIFSSLNLEREAESNNCSMDEVLNILVEKAPYLKVTTMYELKNLLTRLNALWIVDNSDIINGMSEITNTFNEVWGESYGKLLYFDIYQSLDELKSAL